MQRLATSQPRYSWEESAVRGYWRVGNEENIRVTFPF